MPDFDVEGCLAFLRKAQFRLEMIEGMLEDGGELRLVGEVKGAWRILRDVEGTLREKKGGGV